MDPASRVAGALGDRAVEQAPRPGRGHEVEHRLTAGGLAEDRDATGVATESGDVVAHPFERGDLVEQAVVPRDPVGRFHREVGVGEEAHEAEPIVERDEHAAALGQDGRVVRRHRAVTVGVVTAVDPHHHRQRCSTDGRVHVDREAVLALLRAHHLHRQSERLRPGTAKSDAGDDAVEELAHALPALEPTRAVRGALLRPPPRLDGRRCLPTTATDRRRGVGDAAVMGQPSLGADLALDLATGDLDDDLAASQTDHAPMLAHKVVHRCQAPMHDLAEDGIS